MPAPILIAFTTRAGSTGEIAEALGAALREAGLAVDVARMKDLREIGERTAVILGGPLYMGGLPGELHQFLKRNRAALGTVPTWFFAVGPTQPKPSDFDAARAQAEKQLARHPWLKVSDLIILGGKFDPRHLPFPFSLALHLPAFPKDMPASDVRDWGAIRAWAAKIAGQLTAGAVK